MSQVTNQLYTELKPLPQAKEICPRLFKLIRKTTLIAIVIFFSTSAGLVLGLTNWGISIFWGGVGGGIVGLVVGVAMAYFSKFPTNVEEYRLETLEQIKSVTSHPRALSAIDTLKQFFYYPLEEFTHHFIHHVLYNELAVVGDAIDRSREDAIEVWTEFLNHLHAMPIQTPDKEKFLFDGTALTSRFAGKIKEVNIQQLGGFWNFSYNEKDLQSIEQIGKESFGKSYFFSAEKIKATLAKHRPSGIQVARDAETHEILGYGWYYTEKKVVRIAEIARKPGASRLGIGSDLLYAMIRKQRAGQPIQICLRKSNPFAHILERWGFVRAAELPKYYDVDPPEDGALWQLDWQKHKQLLNRS